MKYCFILRVILLLHLKGVPNFLLYFHPEPDGYLLFGAEHAFANVASLIEHLGLYDNVG